MGRKRKMTPSEKASARWDDEPDVLEGRQASDDAPVGEEPANGDHFVISLALIGVVAVVAIVFTTMQGGVPF